MKAMEQGYRHGARAILPLIVPVIGFGVTFGVLAREAGMGILAPVVMSATTFAGSAQFAASSILGVGGGAVAAIVAALLLNARYTPIGLTVAGAIEGPSWLRFLRSQLIVDESWAVATTPEGVDGRRLIGAGLVLYATWVTSTLVGALGARILGDPATLGLDAAFPAVFVALLVPQLAGRRPRLAAGLGALIALALLPWAPAGVPVIAATAAILVGWSR
ncbi:MAG TPA: AzlC family ABC transporter permease [Actinomycetota bacterium]